MKRPKRIPDFNWDGLTREEKAERYGLTKEDFSEYWHDYVNNEGHNSNGDKFEDFHYYLMDFCNTYNTENDCLSVNFK